MPEDYIVKPVAKALQVLEFVAEEGRELALTEISYKVGLPKTTVFRYLYTLRQAGFIAYDPQSDRYRSGVRLWALGRYPGSQSALCDLALPVMKAVRDRFNETINLATLNGLEVTYIEMVESRRSLRMLAKIGSHDPAYSTAVGRAMVAFLPEERWRNHLPAEIPARTAQTQTSLADLHAELRATRRRGFGLERSENEEGACCIGVPIVGPGEQVAAGISLSAPDSRMTQTLEREIAEALRGAAGEISARLCQRSEK